MAELSLIPKTSSIHSAFLAHLSDTPNKILKFLMFLGHKSYEGQHNFNIEATQ